MAILFVLWQLIVKYFQKKEEDTFVFFFNGYVGVAEKCACGCIAGEVIASPGVEIFFSGKSAVQAQADFEAALDLFFEETTLTPHVGVEVIPFTLTYPGGFEPELGFKFGNGLVAVPYWGIIHLWEESQLPKGGKFKWGQPVEVDPVLALSCQYARPADGQNWRVIYSLIHELVDQFIE